MIQRLFGWAQELQDHHIAHGADPLFTALMVDIAVLHNPMHEHVDARDSLAAAYILLNQPCIEMALAVWDGMTPEERRALEPQHRELHHPDDMDSDWSRSLLRTARMTVAAREAQRLLRGHLPFEYGAISPIEEDDLNQLRRVVEYAKWRAAPDDWALLLHPAERYLLGESGALAEPG